MFVSCLREWGSCASNGLASSTFGMSCFLSGACSVGPCCLTPALVCVRVPVLFAAMESPKFWQAQEGSLKLLRLLAETAPDQLRASLPEVVPRISNYVGDGKKQVMDAAYSGGLLTATIVLHWLGSERNLRCGGHSLRHACWQLSSWILGASVGLAGRLEIVRVTLGGMQGAGRFVAFLVRYLAIGAFYLVSLHSLCV
jgi:hypothetical protein